MSPIHHAIDYVELTVTDLAAAKDFYAQAFGWRFNDYGPEYAGIVSPDGAGEVGGLALAATPRAPGGVFVILYSDDLDESLAAIRAAGGEIVQAPYAFPGGRRLHFRDPSGNELGVWAATAAPTRQGSVTRTRPMGSSTVDLDRGLAVAGDFEDDELTRRMEVDR